MMSDPTFEEYLQDLDSSLEEYNAMGLVEKASVRNMWSDELRKREAHQLAMQQARQQANGEKRYRFGPFVYC